LAGHSNSDIRIRPANHAFPLMQLRRSSARRDNPAQLVAFGASFAHGIRLRKTPLFQKS
jgi:hypothetical protein